MTIKLSENCRLIYRYETARTMGAKERTMGAKLINFLIFVSPGDFFAVKSFIEGGSETSVCSVSFSVNTS